MRAVLEDQGTRRSVDPQPLPDGVVGRPTDLPNLIVVDAHEGVALERLFAAIQTVDHVVSMVGDSMAGGFLAASADTMRHVLQSKFWTNRAGSAMGAAMMEERLERLRIPELMHLRGAFFMENLLQGVRGVAETGVFTWAFRGDRPTPMVAAKDVGKRAAELLMARSFDEGDTDGGSVQFREAATSLTRGAGGTEILPGWIFDDTRSPPRSQSYLLFTIEDTILRTVPTIAG